MGGLSLRASRAVPRSITAACLRPVCHPGHRSGGSRLAHFSATNYRLYHCRANIAQYPVTALAVPVLVVAATVAAFVSPAVVAPYFVKLVVTWSVYHFAGQTLGLTMIYARRAGLAVGNVERWPCSPSCSDLPCAGRVERGRPRTNDTSASSKPARGPECGLVCRPGALAGRGVPSSASSAAPAAPVATCRPSFCSLVFHWCVLRVASSTSTPSYLCSTASVLAHRLSMQLNRGLTRGHQPSKSFVLRETTLGSG